MKISKNDKEIKAYLKQFQGPKVNQDRRKRAVNYVCLHMDKKNIMVKTSYLHRIGEQITYISPMTWVVQFLVLLCLSNIVRVWGMNTGFPLLIILAPLFGLVGFTEILKSYSTNMWEMEQTCRYNLKQLWGMKLFLFGFMDYFIMAILIAVSSAAGNSLFYSMIWLLIPFNIANSVYLLLIKIMGRKCSNYILGAAGILLSVLVMKVSNMVYGPGLYFSFGLSHRTSVTCILVSFALLLWTGKRFLTNIGKEEKTKWNYT